MSKQAYLFQFYDGRSYRAITVPIGTNDTGYNARLLVHLMYESGCFWDLSEAWLRDLLHEAVEDEEEAKEALSDGNPERHESFIRDAEMRRDTHCLLSEQAKLLHEARGTCSAESEIAATALLRLRTVRKGDLPKNGYVSIVEILGTDELQSLLYNTKLTNNKNRLSM